MQGLYRSLLPMSLPLSLSSVTYFELAAADSLTPSLKAALLYALSLIAQRRPWLYRMFAYEDEVFAVLTLAVVRRCVPVPRPCCSLRTCHRSSAASLCATLPLRRACMVCGECPGFAAP